MSTEHQQYSTENQADKIREYAAQRGIEIVRTYADEGKSGLNIGGRLALQIEKVWDQLFPAEQERIVRLLIKKVVVTPHNIEVQFQPNGIERLAGELKLPDHEQKVEEVAA